MMKSKQCKIELAEKDRGNCVQTRNAARAMHNVTICGWHLGYFLALTNVCTKSKLVHAGEAKTAV